MLKYRKSSEGPGVSKHVVLHSVYLLGCLRYWEKHEYSLIGYVKMEGIEGKVLITYKHSPIVFKYVMEYAVVYI